MRSSTSTFGLMVVAAAILFAVAPATASAAGGRLWDEAHLLSSRQRADIDKRLAAAARRLGSPVYVLLTDARRPETAAAVAARAFSERQLGGPEDSNPVLLVVAVRQRAAAIETGKGNAGIVPEIDAAPITNRLQNTLSRTNATEALARAIDDIVVSAQATAARRRPLSAEEDPTPPDATHMPIEGARPFRADAGSGATAEAASGAPADAGVAAAGSPGGAPADKARSRSKFSIAAAIAVLILLALALRRRRQLTAARRLAEQAVDPKRGSHSPRR